MGGRRYDGVRTRVMCNILAGWEGVRTTRSHVGAHTTRAAFGTSVRAAASRRMRSCSSSSNASASARSRSSASSLPPCVTHGLRDQQAGFLPLGQRTHACTTTEITHHPLSNTHARTHTPVFEDHSGCHGVGLDRVKHRNRVIVGWTVAGACIAAAARGRRCR